LFNLIIEFIVFSLVAFFNYFWLDEIIKLIRFQKIRIPVIILSNIIIYLIIIPGGKLFHSVYFSSMKEVYNKEIIFDIRNFLIINISVFFLAVRVAYILIIMKKMKIAEEENLRLAEEKSKAELNALKEQISPHFFFNTLSSLSTIVINADREVALEFLKCKRTYPDFTGRKLTRISSLVRSIILFVR